jgi:hypothetical protein
MHHWGSFKIDDDMEIFKKTEDQGRPIFCMNQGEKARMLYPSVQSAMATRPRSIGGETAMEDIA